MRYGHMTIPIVFLIRARTSDARANQFYIYPIEAISIAVRVFTKFILFLGLKLFFTKIAPYIKYQTYNCSMEIIL